MIQIGIKTAIIIGIQTRIQMGIQTAILIGIQNRIGLENIIAIGILIIIPIQKKKEEHMEIIHYLEYIKDAQI